MDIKKIKSEGKEAFKRNYWNCVLVAFIMSLLTAGAGAASAGRTQNAGDAGTAAQQQALQELESLPQEAVAVAAASVFAVLMVFIIIGIVLKIFVFNPLKVGGYRFFKKNNIEEGVKAGALGEGFGNYGHIFATLFLSDLFFALWSMLFIIPGLIKAYSYRLVPYLVKDEPGLSATETITRSRELMDGHKMEAFLLDLSFIGWILLGVVTFGLVDVFWTDPYLESSRARFYLELTK